jgi:parallel beta-helix repeat protein
MLSIIAASSFADTHYVDINCITPTPPYTNWMTAATVIQDAVDVAAAGDTVWVTNGAYATGGRAVYGTMMNRVAVDKPVVVRSVNGPQSTLIVGNGQMDESAIRCAYVTNGASLAGFTLTNGATLFYGETDTELSGGGVWCEGGGLVSNCWIVCNSSFFYGGGAYGGNLNDCKLTANASFCYGGGASGSVLANCTLSGNTADEDGGGANDSKLTNCTLTNNNAFRGGGANKCMLTNCVLRGNSAVTGGGAAGGTLMGCILNNNSADLGGAAWGATWPAIELYNCTLTGNSARYAGGGAYWASLKNCIIFFNTALVDENCSETSDLNYCCTTPMPSGGNGNITDDPLLASISHLSATSPCIGMGNVIFATGTDIDGERWNTQPSIGCDEFRSRGATGSLNVSVDVDYTQVAVGYSVNFAAAVAGLTTKSRWSFGDGMTVSNRPYVAHAWVAPGEYDVVLTVFNATHPAGVSATVRVRVVTQPVHYVARNSSTPVAPYSNWSSAATGIQEAVEAATVAGSLILVSNGVYDVGGAAGYPTASSPTNRVAIYRPVTVRSVSGPSATVIDGQAAVEDSAVRCVFMASGAVLEGFTVTNGATLESGGGVWCAVPNAFVSNCVLAGNSARYAGGGADGGTLYNCTLFSNFADSGGGVNYARLRNCTLIGNTAVHYGGGAEESILNNCVLSGNRAGIHGGGTSESTLNNCTVSGNSAIGLGGGTCNGTVNNSIVYFNSAPVGENYFFDFAKFNFCCTTPMPADGIGNSTDDPQLASVSHLSKNSPCIGKGSAFYVSGTDIDGETWRTPPSVGCDEFRSGAATGPLTVAVQADYTTVTPGFPVNFTAVVDGRTTDCRWSFDDGVIVNNRPYVAHAWASVGEHVVTLTAFNETHPAGVSATVTVWVVKSIVHYVAQSNPTPVAPYTSWTTAANSIQVAIDVAGLGAMIVVSNGVYDTGSVAGYPAKSRMKNRVAIHKPMTVRSLNGPSVTVIQGEKDPLTTNGNATVRCVCMAKGAVLVGFTLTNGATRVWSGDSEDVDDGGGVWCAGLDAVVSNCIFTCNSAESCGGGAYGCTLYNCTFSGNTAGYFGGGACGGALYNCLLIGNIAGHSGGGVDGWRSKLNNCTLVGNSAGFSGGGTYYGDLDNCIVYFNSASIGENSYIGTLKYCCTTLGNFEGTNTITVPPLFVNPDGGDYRLQALSPCINAGLNQEWMFGATDLAGKPRIRNGTVDIGAYEIAFAANLKGLLQGSYSTNTHVMAASISTNLPTRSPFAADARSATTVPSNKVDWALVEVKDTNGISLASTSVFLDPQGRVLDEGGRTTIPVEVSAGSYYLMLKHRNHLSAMSAQPVAFTNTLVSYDFTTGADKIFGGTNACVELEPGVWGLIAGDADGDGRITPVDREIVRRQKGMTGYLQGDLNLDGKVDGGDQ